MYLLHSGLCSKVVTYSEELKVNARIEEVVYVHIQRFNHCFNGEKSTCCHAFDSHSISNSTKVGSRWEGVKSVACEQCAHLYTSVKVFKSWYCYELLLYFGFSIICLLIHLLSWVILCLRSWIRVKFILLLFNCIIYERFGFKFWFLWYDLRQIP